MEFAPWLQIYIPRLRPGRHRLTRDLRVKRLARLARRDRRIARNLRNLRTVLALLEASR
jgi:hypothetical protein